LFAGKGPEKMGNFEKLNPLKWNPLKVPLKELPKEVALKS